MSTESYRRMCITLDRAIAMLAFWILCLWFGCNRCVSANPSQPTWCPSNCACNETLLSVSCVNSRLAEIPANLPKFIKSLNLRQNRISVLPTNIFNGFQNLTFLYLNQNRITHIEEGAFTGMVSLVQLHIGDNLLSIKTLETSVFEAVRQDLPALQQLHVTHMNFTLRSGSLAPLRSIFLKVLDVSSNRGICNSADGAFFGLNLTLLDMSSCQCESINTKAFSGLTLSELKLHSNRFSSFPDFALHNETLLFRQGLISLLLDQGNIYRLNHDDLVGFESLQKLHLTDNHIETLNNGLFEDLKNLLSINLQNNRLDRISKFAFNSTSIQKIHLDENSLYIDEEHMELFRYAVGLEELYMSKFTMSSSNVTETIFQNISTLKVLSLRDSRLTSIPTKTLNGLTQLRSLTFDNLNIGYVSEDMFESLYSLTKLSLINNNLRVINATSFPRYLLENITKLYLTNNPWDCSCELFWFMEWIKDNENKLVSYGRREYTCGSPLDKVGSRLINLHLTPEKCLTKPLCISVWSTLAVGSFQLVITLLISSMYKLRWYLRLWFFNFSNWLRNRPPNMIQQDFKFDLFVSHNAQDIGWVKNVLLPELEVKTKPPFKLCVYSRNWLVGRDIADCITEALALSRKTLLVVTNEFAKSEWCQFELTMAQHRVIETDNDNVVLAVMEDIEPINLNPRLRLMMKRKVYLQWTDDEAGRRLFWERLKQLLRSEGESLVEAMPSTSELQSVLA